MFKHRLQELTMFKHRLQELTMFKPRIHRQRALQGILDDEYDV